MERTIRTGIGLALVVVLGLFVGRLLVNVAGANPVVKGFDVQSERGGCPGTPNCVSTYATTPDAAIDPIACDADRLIAEAAFAAAMRTLPDVETTGATTWVVYSRLMKFPDDVRIEVSQRGIEVISSSRLGAGDFGVNRNRVEAMRTIIAEDERCNPL